MSEEKPDLLTSIPSDVIALICNKCGYRNEVGVPEGYEEMMNHILNNHASKAEISFFKKDPFWAMGALDNTFVNRIWRNEIER